MRRKVLIVEDEPSIRKVLFSLLGGLGLDGEIAQSGQQALDILTRDKFDAVLLDLRCTELRATEVVSQIQQIRPSLVGQVLVITGEVPDTKIMKMVERHFLPHIADYNLLENLRGCLRTLFGITPSSKPASDTSPSDDSLFLAQPN